MAKDFFDDDLLSGEPAAEASEAGDSVEADAGSEGPISRQGIGRMADQKQQISSQVVGTIKQLEELRQKQEALEREKNNLEELTRKQDEYEHNKREIITRLARGIRLLEKEELQANRMAELLSVMRSRFRDTLDELRGIDEAAWAEDRYEEELNKALVVVEDARDIYRKALAKIDAENWVKDAGQSQATGKIHREVGRELLGRPGFAYWVMVGLAVSLPFVLVGVVLFVAYLFLVGVLP